MYPKGGFYIAAALYLMLMAGYARAQDLDPRAYIWLPVKTSTLVTGFAYSYGGVVTDPTLPIQDLEADVQGATLGFAHTFNMFGLTAQALVVQPYSWAQVSGKVIGEQQSITRSGFGDMRMRLTLLVLGAPAAGLSELVKAPKKTIVGVSMNIIAPTGQFFSDKLINLGTNRWSFRPEVAISQPLSKRWLVDVYAGVWFFTNNNSFFPGNSIRTQNPLGAFQAHISYNIGPRLWVALNATYYMGGRSQVDDVFNDDRQDNTRIGFTGVIPVGKRNAIKLAGSTGAVVRLGQDFTTFSLGWSTTWFGGTIKK
jgi:hypothetical protein